jgi:hypothetical protein
MFKQKARSLSTLGLMGFLAACGGRSGLDDYVNGIPAVVPVPESGGDGDGDGDGGAGTTEPDGGVTEDDAGNDAGPEPSPSKGGAVGEACDDQNPCAGDNGTCLETVQILGGLVTIEYPGGYCTVPNCESDQDCPDGSACFAGAGTPACLQLCEETSDCRDGEGYTCGTIPFPGVTDTKTYCLPPQ